MTITTLKAKNQLTIPAEIVKRMHLKPRELFAVDVVDNFIKLTPVEMSPRYTAEELKTIDTIVASEKTKGKSFKPGKDFTGYIKKIKT
jgi:bifunctional DNA-binding transcriptional regulator/antitoxin component of YhaV-PrlF toxin-antitoxin module